MFNQSISFIWFFFVTHTVFICVKCLNNMSGYQGIFYILTASHLGTKSPSTGTQPRRICEYCVPKEKRTFMQSKMRRKVEECKKNRAHHPSPSALSCPQRRSVPVSRNLPCPLPCSHCPASFLFCPILLPSPTPCPAMPFLVLPCRHLLFTAVPCRSLPCPSCSAFLCPALPCNAVPCCALSCRSPSYPALSCSALHCPVLSCSALPCSALSCPA